MESGLTSRLSTVAEHWQTHALTPTATEEAPVFGSTGLLIFLPAALAACLIVACPLKRWTRRATATVSSSIWPEWLPRPPDSTALAFVEESPPLQQLPSSLPELLLIVPTGVPSPGMVAEALTSVGLVVQPIPLDDCEGVARLKGHHRLLGVWAPAELLERIAALPAHWIDTDTSSLDELEQLGTDGPTSPALERLRLCLF